MKFRLILLLGLLNFPLPGVDQASAAELRAYWTLDNLTTGIQNQGTDGATSNLSPNTTSPTLTSGIIGGGLAFNGTSDILRTTVAGNAAQDLTNYPFTLSTWINKSGSDPAGDGHNFGIGMSRITVGNIQYGVGIVQATGLGAALTRNTDFDSQPGGTNIIDGQWHHVLGVFNSTSSIQVFVDGKLVATDNAAESFNNNVDTLFVGGTIRDDTELITRMGGKVDDTGLFLGSLTASDVALINGLGQIGGLGLDYLDDAQDLLLAGIGETAELGGYTWIHVNGLSGTSGDYGGSLSNFDGYIVTSNSGEGLLMALPPVPEPASLSLVALGALVMLHRRKRG